LLNPLVSQLHQDMAGPPSLGTNPCTTPWPNPKLFPGPSYLFPTEAQPEPGHQQTAPRTALSQPESHMPKPSCTRTDPSSRSTPSIPAPLLTFSL
jgi:hypothetical protein